MKILLTATVQSHICQFHRPLVEMLRGMGDCEIHVAARDNLAEKNGLKLDFADKVFDVPFERSPFSPKNIRAYREIKSILSENQYDYIHCNTPVGGVVTRLAARKARKKGTKVFYTAHGFHFYKGAPLINWMLFYPMEKLCAHYTDKLITINQEDYALARKKMKAKEVLYVPGVGINVDRFCDVSVDKLSKRRELGIPEDAVLLFSVGELNENKNHQTVINAVARMGREDIHYVIAGNGPKEEALRQQAAALGLGGRLHLLGYRRDVPELLAAADLFVFPSYREGLSVALMEAMANGLPCAVSRIRGNTDLIDAEGGAHFDPHKVETCVEALETMLSRDHAAMAAHNQQKIRYFSLQSVMEMMKSIYGAGS